MGRISAGVSAEERSSLITVRNIVEDLTETFERQVPTEEIIVQGQLKGLSKEIVLAALEKLQRMGDVFEPKTGFISKIYDV